MQVAKRLPLEDSDFIQKLRFGYVAAQVISLAIYFYIQFQVSRLPPDRYRFLWHCFPG